MLTHAQWCHAMLDLTQLSASSRLLLLLLGIRRRVPLLCAKLHADSELQPLILSDAHQKKVLHCKSLLEKTVQCVDPVSMERTKMMRWLCTKTPLKMLEVLFLKATLKALTSMMEQSLIQMGEQLIPPQRPQVHPQSNTWCLRTHF